jgi:hypothetical protein
MRVYARGFGDQRRLPHGGISHYLLWRPPSPSKVGDGYIRSLLRDLTQL